jgi:small redox-active disulfide protein 2
MTKIQILGTGCPKCNQLAVNAQQAATELGIDYQLEKVTKINDITNYGVMMTPAIAIDGTVQASGKVVPPETIKEWLSAKR